MERGRFGANVILSEQERIFGDYSPGRFAWILQDIQRLEKPIPYRGAQGLFTVPDSILEGC
jgi:hypothetical protein